MLVWPPADVVLVWPPVDVASESAGGATTVVVEATRGS